MESQNHTEQKQSRIIAFRQWVQIFNDRTVLILIGLLFIGAMVMVWHVARLQSDLMETMALANADLYTQALAEFRTLYTRNVVERVRGQGINVTHDLEKDEKAIPLPATLSMKLGQSIGAHHKGAETRLYSAYPFPWRKEQGGLQDNFGREAWGFLTQNPQQPFFRFEQFKGRLSIRYATADLMRASCVDCHNQHPDSPKNDWKENDVRGVLEIIHPLDSLGAAAETSTSKTFGLMVVLGLISLGGVALVINKVHRTSWILEQRVAERTEELWQSNLELKKEIQERWQAEAELVKVSRQHNLILNSAGEGIHGLDLEGKTTFVNPAGAKMLGYEVEELVGVPIHATIHHSKPDRSPCPQEWCPMYAAFKDGTVHHVDDEVLWRKDGTSFPVEYSSTPIWEDGQLVGAVVTFKDITERKRAEAKFRLVIEAAPSGMLMVDHQGAIILANRHLTQQFGYGQEELLGQPIEVLVPARFRDQHPAHRTAFFQTSTPRQMGSGRDLYGLRKDGSEFPVEIGLNPVTTDEGTFVLASIIDITARKRHEEQQMRLSNRLLLATQSANIGIWELNISQNELIWDSQMYTLYGLPPDSKPVPYATWVNALDAEDREAAEASLEKALRGERDFNTEFRVIWPDKSVHYIKGAALVDRNSKGKAIRMIGVNWDITKERNAEEVLQIHMNKLKRSNKELEDFASIASHDLQEPLRKIQTFGDRLKGKWAETLGPQGVDYLERMQHAAGRMQTLIADLLSFSRITSKANPFVQVDLAKVANEVVSDLEIRIAQVGGKVEIDDLPIIEADPTQMRQLFQNLIGNAMKFHKKDEPPLVNIQSQYVNGNHASASQDRWIRLTVSDNGIGFDEKYVEKIFGIFQRLHSHSEYEGTGVGLAICQKIAARHHGRIDVNSTLGKGASFSITLPTVQGKDNKLT